MTNVMTNEILNEEQLDGVAGALAKKPTSLLT